MRTETRLDCATFQLDEARTRCELWVTAGNETERLASGSLKPFLVHLKEAQQQISRGQSSIRLQPPSLGKALWFTKGTIERFVRFVSTPDVLERLSIVETERRQLEEAINILAAGEQQMKQATSGGVAFEGEEVGDGDGAGDNSKNQLLVAMDARRIMLQKEQLNAFTRAAAAGFDLACMADMVDFADCFGAVRLREACLKFASVCKKMQEKGQFLELEATDHAAETGGPKPLPTEESAQKALKARRTWGAQDMATVGQLQQNGLETGQDDGLRAAVSLPESAAASTTQASYATPVKAQRSPDFRAIPDSPPNIADAESPSTLQDTPTSRRLPRRVSSPRRRSCSPMRKVQIARSGSKRAGMVVIRNINYASPGSPKATQPPSVNDSTEDSDSVLESEDNKDELNRRLSVQDAISLFERRQRDSLEAQSAKSETRRSSVETSTSANKSVLRRWSSIGDNTSSTEMSETGKAPEKDGSQSDQAEQHHSRQPDLSQTVPTTQQDAAAKLEEKRKSWITAQNDLEWKFQQLKLQEAALPAVRSSRDTARSPQQQQQQQQQQQAGVTTQFGFQYRGQKSGKAPPVSRSWSAASEKDLVSAVRQAEVTAEAQSKASKKAPRQTEDQGRFYEQYRERRDAKIRQESDLKRAERESKLKAMQETLDRRKAELAAAGTKSAERQVKPSALNKKGPPQPGRSGTSTRSPIVPSSQSTPRVTRQQLTPEPKSTVARKLSPGPQKPPSSRGLSSSPKVPKSNPTVAQRRPSNMSENPLSRSMPSLSELRKENTRPVRSTQQSKSTPAKNTKPGSNITRNKAISKVLPLEANGVVPSEAQLAKDNRKPSKVDEPQSLMTPLKLMELQAQASPHESKPFLRKGRGIGPGAGPGVMKLKAVSSSEQDEEKTDTEDCVLEGDLSVLPPPVLTEFEAPVPLPAVTEVEPVKILPGSVRESLDMDIDDSSNEATVQEESYTASTMTSTAEGKSQQPVQVDPVERLVREDVSSFQVTDWNVRRPQIVNSGASPSKLTLMQQLATEEHVVALQSFGDRQASMLSLGSSSPCSSTSGVPASQLQHSVSDLDGVKSRRKWGSSQKPVISQQVSKEVSKEGPKGFKRLLKFGRKSRGSSTSEWVSASTTSEGEDTDDTGNSTGSSYLRRSTEAFSKEADGNGSRSFFSLSSFRSKSSELKTKF